MVMLDRKHTDDDDRCHDHETRIRVLENSYNQLIARIDRTELAVHAIEKAIVSLQEEMENHIDVMRQHIDLSFSKHEVNEMQMHKDMLIQAMRAVLRLVVLLASGIGLLGWWMFQHLVGV